MNAGEIKTEINTNEEITLPVKSSHLYKKRYDLFMSWRSENKITSLSEDVLLSYFESLGFKPTTLWVEYSKLKATLILYHQTDISKYTKLLGWLKKKSEGFEAKKAQTFTRDELERFIKEAPDLNYLQIKVAVIFGIMGACRRQQLHNLKVQHVIDTQQGRLIVHIMNAKNKINRKFAVTGEYYDICKQYMNLRPKCDNNKFFIRYNNGKCNNQNVGINTFGAMGKVVAKVLKLPNPELYTSHCFKRTSVSFSVFDEDEDSFLKKRRWQRAAEPVEHRERFSKIEPEIEDEIESVVSSAEELRKRLQTSPSPGPSNMTYTQTSNSNLPTKPVDARRASKLCRFCGQFSEECVPVSPSYRTDDKTTLAFNNISIQIEFTDDLPDTTCKDCDIKLQIMYDFVKVVQNAQESLNNAETEKIEDAEEVDTGEFEMITVKTEYEEHEYDGSYDEGDGDDTNKESDDDEYDTKEGILDSLTLGETIFIKQNASHKRKSSRSSPEKSKKTKIGLDNENTELTIDIKEEVSDGDDTNGNATSNTGCFINNEIKDVPSAKLIKRYVLCKTRSDGNS